MNILIVGNGFDLSHYLPTKYDHFMVAMDAIENWDESKGDMVFDDIFGSLYEKEDYFLGYTKAMYKTDDIKISVDQIKKLKKQLKENVWYQYFSDHVREVKTWIDFETKIEEALEIVFEFFEQLEHLHKNIDFFKMRITHKKHNNNDSSIVLRNKESYVLSLLNILLGEFYILEDGVSSSGYNINIKKEVGRVGNWKGCTYDLNGKYVFETKSYNEYKFNKAVEDGFVAQTYL